MVAFELRPKKVKQVIIMVVVFRKIEFFLAVLVYFGKKKSLFFAVLVSN